MQKLYVMLSVKKNVLSWNLYQPFGHRIPYLQAVSRWCDTPINIVAYYKNSQTEGEVDNFLRRSTQNNCELWIYAKRERTQIDRVNLIVDL